MNLARPTRDAGTQDPSLARAAAAGIIGARYQVLNELGSGGMGEVFRVLDRLTGRVATLKRLKAAHTLDSTSIGADCRIALAQEFRLLASLRHPNIISVLDYGFDASGDPYFTMDLEENARHHALLLGSGWCGRFTAGVPKSCRTWPVRRPLRTSRPSGPVRRGPGCRR